MGQCASSASRAYLKRVAPDRLKTPTTPTKAQIITKSLTTTTSARAAPCAAAEDSSANRGCKTPPQKPESVPDTDCVISKSENSLARRSEPPDLVAFRPAEPQVTVSRTALLETTKGKALRQKGANEDFRGAALGARKRELRQPHASYPPNWGMVSMPPDVRSQQENDRGKLSLLQENRPTPLLPFSPFSSVPSVVEVDPSQTSISIPTDYGPGVSRDRSGSSVEAAGMQPRCNSLVAEREEREAALQITPPRVKRRAREETPAPVAHHVAPPALPPPTFPPSPLAQEPLSPPVASHTSWRLPHTASVEKSRAPRAVENAASGDPDPASGGPDAAPFPWSPGMDLTLDNACYLPHELSASSDDDRDVDMTPQKIPSGMPDVTTMMKVEDSSNFIIGSPLPEMKCRALSKRVPKPTVKTYRSHVTRDPDPSRPTTASDASHDGLSDSATNGWLVPPSLSHTQPARHAHLPRRESLPKVSLPAVLHAKGLRGAAPCVPALPPEFTDFARACSYVDI